MKLKRKISVEKKREKNKKQSENSPIKHSVVQFIGNLPLLIPIVEKLKIADIIDKHCPMERQNENGLTHGEVIEALVYNRITASRPMYRIEQWAADFSVESLFGIDPSELNDDRIARALDALSDKILVSQSDIVLNMVEKFGISLNTVNFDITSLSFEGDFDESEIVKYGYSRDKRPDLKQVNLSLNVTQEDAIPILCQILEGNKSDITTVIDNMTKLKENIKINSSKLIMDKGMSSANNLDFLMKNGVGFITPLAWTSRIKKLVIDSGDIDFIELNYKGSDQKSKFSAKKINIELTTAKTKETKKTKETLDLKDENLENLENLKSTSTISTIKATKENKNFTVFGHLYFSSKKQKDDAKSREKSIEKVKKIFDEIIPKLNARNYKKRDYCLEQIIKKASKFSAFSLFSYEIKEENGILSLSYNLDENAVKAEAALDGKYILITEDENLDSETVLTSYKTQNQIEQRFRHLKSHLKVSPLFLKKDNRIISLVFVTILALTVYSLLERLCRLANLKTTSFMLFQLFGNCFIVKTVLLNGEIITTPANLNPFQEKILEALDFPKLSELV
jgi:transposase